MIRSSLIVSLLAALGSGVAFVSQLVFARTFGAGVEFDSYLVAISLPLTIAGLGGGVLGFQVVPALTGRPREGFDATLVGMGLGLGGLALAVAAIGLGALPWTVPLLTGRMPLESRPLVMQASVVAWCWLPLAVIGAVLTGGLHVRQKFAAATLPQGFPALGAMLGCLFGHEALGVNSLAWGQLAGYLAMVGCLLVALRPTTGRPDWTGTGSLLRDAPLALAALLVFVIYPLPDAVFGARAGVAGVSLLGYAQRLVVGFSGLAVVGATTVIFPRLANRAAQGEHAALKDDIARGLRIMLVCMMPAAAVLATLALPLVRFLFRRGAFGDDEAMALAGLLPWMFGGMVAMSCMSLSFKALFAQGRVRQAALLSSSCAALYFLLSALLVDRFGLRGIGAAYAATWWALFLLILRSLGIGAGLDVAFLLRLAVISAVSAAAAFACRILLFHEEAPGAASSLATLAAGAAAAGLVFAAASLGWPGLAEARFLRNGLLKRHER